MASSGDLARAVSTTTGLDVEVLRGYVKSLRNANMIATAGRGPGAAAMELRDAATFVLAVLATSSATKAPDLVRRLAGFVPIESDLAAQVGAAINVPERTRVVFRDYLEAILSKIAATLTSGLEGADAQSVELSFQAPPERLTLVWTALRGSQRTKPVTINFWNNRRASFDSKALDAFGMGDGEAGLILKRSITTRTLAAVAAEIALSESVMKRGATARKRSYEDER